ITLFPRWGKSEFMVYNAATNSNNNDTLVMPMSSSAQPPSGRYMDHHQDPLEDVTKSFSKKRMGRPLGSKNKPKTCIVIKEDTQNFIEKLFFQGGGNNEFMVYNAATNSNNNDTLGMPMSSSAQPPSGSEFMVYNAATNSNNNDTLVMPMSSSAPPSS
ncbi:hypothetical protein RYX36_011101, partial [Vicia faba]